MKIDKKLIKELVDNLSEFNLTELEYQEGQTKIKVSKATKRLVEQNKTSAMVSPNKAVLNTGNENELQLTPMYTNRIKTVHQIPPTFPTTFRNWTCPINAMAPPDDAPAPPPLPPQTV